MTSPRYGSLSARTECNRCGAPLPLDAPVLEVSCAQCSGQVSVPAETWGAMLSELDDRIDQLAEGQGHTANKVIGGQKLVYEIKRAMPHCEKCGTPLEIADLPVGTSRNLACTQCGDPASTEPTPPWLGQTAPNARQLYRVDPDPRLEGSNRVALSPPPAPRPVALTCPSCGAGLHITVENPRLTTCEFCSADVYLPDAVWQKLHPVKVVTPFYVRFEGQTWREIERERQHLADRTEANRAARARAENEKREELRRFIERHKEGCGSFTTWQMMPGFVMWLVGPIFCFILMFPDTGYRSVIVVTAIGLFVFGWSWWTWATKRAKARYARTQFEPELLEEMARFGYSVNDVKVAARDIFEDKYPGDAACHKVVEKL